MAFQVIEPVFVNVYGVDSEESIPPDWETIPGLLKRFTSTVLRRGEDCVGVDSESVVDM
jgi:hypothetical protein